MTSTRGLNFAPEGSSLIRQATPAESWHRVARALLKLEIIRLHVNLYQLSVKTTITFLYNSSFTAKMAEVAFDSLPCMYILQPISYQHLLSEP